MSVKDKLIYKLINNPSGFSYAEAQSLLGKLGYIEDTCGKTSGSRVAFINEETKHVIRLHKPHPEKTLKKYAAIELIRSLKEMGYI